MELTPAAAVEDGAGGRRGWAASELARGGGGRRGLAAAEGCAGARRGRAAVVAGMRRHQPGWGP
jgi:hypothetical protein